MSIEALDHYARVASELVRALRGRRSRSQLSRKLNYSSNIVRRWEAGQCWPTAARFLSMCGGLGVDLHQAFSSFYGRRPAWLTEVELDTPRGVARFLSDLRGNTPIGALASTAAVSRFCMARWLKGTAQPRLHEFLMVIDITTSRLLDFVSTLADPMQLPSLRDESRKLRMARDAAYTTPWSHGVLRALELDDFQSAKDLTAETEAQWLCDRLGIARTDVEAAQQALERSGQVRRHNGRLQLVSVAHVNTGADAKRARRLKAFWAQVAVRRLSAGLPGLHGYSLFAVSREAMRELREIQLRYVREMQTIIKNSTPSDCVGLYCAHLIDLSIRQDNAFADSRADPELEHDLHI